MTNGISTENIDVAIILAAMQLTIESTGKNPDMYAESYKKLYKAIYEAFTER